MVGVGSYCKSGSQWSVWGVTVSVTLSGGCGSYYKSDFQRWLWGVTVRVALGGCNEIIYSEPQVSSM